MRRTLRTTAAATAVLIGCALAGCAATPGRQEALDPVMAVAVSADGRTLAASTDSEDVALFDFAPLRFRVLLTPEGVKKKPTTENLFRSPPLALSPDGRLLIAAGVAGHIVGWEVDSGVVRFQTPLADRVADLEFAPDGCSFLTVGPTIKRFNAENGSPTVELKPPESAAVTAVATSPDGKYILAGLSTGGIAEYDAVAGNIVRVLPGHALAVTGVAVAPDGSSFASTAGRFDPRIWNPKENAPVSIRLSEMGQVGESLDKSIDEARGLMLFAWLLGTARGFQIVGAPTMGAPPVGGGPTGDRAARETSPYCGARIAYSPNGRFLATTAQLPMLSGEFHLVLADVIQKKARVINGIHGCSVAFSPDSRFVITGGLGAPQIWNAETGQEVVSAE